MVNENMVEPTQLAVLFPTYNRCEPLMENLRLWTALLRDKKLNRSVQILVSDNCSVDGTAKAVSDFSSANTDVVIRLFVQQANLGLECNALFLLETARTDYVMYMGDDDFVAPEYIVRVIAEIGSNPDAACVLPSHRLLNTCTKEIVPGRDFYAPVRRFPASFASCLENSWCGHQLSGILLRRRGLSEAYKAKKVRNIYPFIFMVGYASLHGSVVRLSEHPLTISEVPQNEKYWSYGRDGLVGDIFDNYRCLLGPTALIKRARLELRLLKNQPWRFTMYLKQGLGPFIGAILAIVRSHNTSVLTKVIFPLALVPTILVYSKVRARLAKVSH